MRRDLAILAIAFLISLPLVTPRIYASDEVQYYAYLRSLLFDRDLDLRQGLAKRRAGKVRGRPAGRERQALGPLVLLLGQRAGRATCQGQERRQEDPEAPKGPPHGVGGRHDASDSILASRTTIHEPLGCFRRMDSALPVRTAVLPPAMGTTRTVKMLQQYAKSPDTSISWTSPVDSIRY